MAQIGLFCFLFTILLSLIPIGIQQLHSPLFGVDLFKNQLHQSESIEFRNKLNFELWFNQTLDHFDASGSKKWRQRYFQRWGYVKKCCLEKTPIFLMLGGEFPALETQISNESAVDSYAKKYCALIVLLEHRFYGESKPTANLSTENLKKYLSAKQALADAANFIRGYKKENNFGKGNKVVVFGGSYPGMLATWLRAEYPDLVAGAIASSAPLQAKFDFKEFLEVVGADLEAHNCLDQVKAAFAEVDKLLKDSSQAHKLSKLFNTCQPMNITNQLDVQIFVDMLISKFVIAATQNSTLLPKHAYNLPRVCRVMANSNRNPLDNLVLLVFLDQFKFAHLKGLVPNLGCLQNSFKTIMDMHSSVEFTQWGIARQWAFQTCNEFGFYQTTSSPKQPFGSWNKLQLYLLLCQKLFGITKRQVACNIRATNRKYGGLKPNATKVLLTNGGTDPWHPLGVKSGIVSPQVEGLIIPRASHCLDMSANSEGDSKELRKARAKILKRIGEFLN